MNNKNRSTIIATFFLTAFVAGCSSEPPKCSDEATFTLIRQIISDNVLSKETLVFKAVQATDKELQKSIRIELPRASAFDKKIKKYSCEAKLIAGDTVELPITYESQLDDKNEHIVTLGGISWPDKLQLYSAISEMIDKIRTEK